MRALMHISSLLLGWGLGLGVGNVMLCGAGSSNVQVGTNHLLLREKISNSCTVLGNGLMLLFFMSSAFMNLHDDIADWATYVFCRSGFSIG
jgi:hypothetical protein